MLHKLGLVPPVGLSQAGIQLLHHLESKFVDLQVSSVHVGSGSEEL